MRKSIIALWSIVIYISFVGVSATLFAEGSDAWIIDTRRASFDENDDTPGNLLVNRSVKVYNRWEPARLDEFYQTHDPAKPLVVIIHGNWMKLNDAKRYAMSFFRQVQKDDSDVRLLFWSWPSERRTDLGLREDALLKGRRAERQAMFLTHFLQQLPKGSKVSLVGFSFGARLACETLELLETDARFDGELHIRTVLLAAALDKGSLCPGKKYGNALSATEKMLVHVNPFDHTLKFYPWLVRGGRGPQAVGREDVNRRGMPEEYSEKIKSVSVQSHLGREHDFYQSLRALHGQENDYRFYLLFEE